MAKGAKAAIAGLKAELAKEYGCRLTRKHHLDAFHFRKDIKDALDEVNKKLKALEKERHLLECAKTVSEGVTEIYEGEPLYTFWGEDTFKHAHGGREWRQARTWVNCSDPSDWRIEFENCSLGGGFVNRHTVATIYKNPSKEVVVKMAKDWCAKGVLPENADKRRW